MKLTFRTLEGLPIEDIVKLFNKIYEDYYWVTSHTVVSLHQVVLYMDISCSLSTIMYENQNPIGLSLIARRKGECWLYAFGIIPSKRGLGYGQLLLSEVMEKCRYAGSKSIGLEVLLQNKKARKLYYKNNFQKHCYLDAYATTSSLTVTNDTDIYCQHVTPQIAFQGIQKVNSPLVVWSRRKETLCRRNIQWLAAYSQGALIGLLVYNNQTSLSFYRFDIVDVEKAGLILNTLLFEAQKQNPHCVRKVAVNINDDDLVTQQLLYQAGFKRFMRQEFMIAKL